MLALPAEHSRLLCGDGRALLGMLGLQSSLAIDPPFALSGSDALLPVCSLVVATSG